MKHKEYKRLVADSDTAILFVHGILGTPDHFDRFLPLVPNTVSVYNLLLDGHGKAPLDFARSSMQNWEAQVKRIVDHLCATHERIYIVAHSMGSLLAIEQAIANQKVRGMFLLAVPLKLFIKPKMIVNSLKVYFDKIGSDPVALAAKNCCGVSRDKNLFHYIGWIPRFFELFGKIRRTRSLLPALKTPCCVYQSSRDEMVSIRSVKYLENNFMICIKKLKNSGHYYYDKEDMQFLLSEFSEFIKTII